MQVLELSNRTRRSWKRRSDGVNGFPFAWHLSRFLAGPDRDSPAGPHPTQRAYASSTLILASRFQPIRLFPVPSCLNATVRDGWIDVDNFLPIQRPSRVLPRSQPWTWVRVLVNPALPNADLSHLKKFHSQILPFAYGCLPRVDVSPLQTVSIRNPEDPRWRWTGADSRQ